MPKPSNDAAPPAEVVKAYAPGPFGQMHYRRAGPPPQKAKPTVLCFHPSPMTSLVFEDFLPQMGRDRECIAVDTPGYGSSSPPTTPPSIADYAHAMGQLADELELETVDLFGYHTGCAVAVELARQRPKLVRRILMNSALVFTPEEADGLRKGFAARSAKTLDQLIAEAPDRWKSWRAFWRDVPDEARAWALFCDSDRNVARSTWGFNAVFQYDFSSAIASLDQPMMVFNPSDDLHEMTPRVLPLMRHGRIHDLPGWTHGFLNAHPDVIADLARGFFDA